MHDAAKDEEVSNVWHTSEVDLDQRVSIWTLRKTNVETLGSWKAMMLRMWLGMAMLGPGVAPDYGSIPSVYSRQ
ncbi:hypothetical protein RJT34_12562 [Clitoria ternatea]|uniref:Uncharacterized protein n=1 Tax=Clitoria ternatea TaxID=43366 RepID=A0AAN9JM02_CLITE